MKVELTTDQIQILKHSLIDRLDLLKRKRRNAQSDLANETGGIGVSQARLERLRDRVNKIQAEIDETSELWKTLKRSETSLYELKEQLDSDLAKRGLTVPNGQI